mgnify:CR=1 FL=1
MAKIGAVIIGGGTISDPMFREAAGADCKSLITLHDKLMIQWIAEAVKASDSVGEVAVVGPACLADGAMAQVADHVLPEEAHEVDSLLAAVDALDDPDRVLMVSGDTPLLTPEAVDDLVLNAPKADIVYPSVDKSSVMGRFADRKWAFIRTCEGEFVGSSTVLFRPTAFRHHEDMLRRVFDARSDVMALVKMLGIGFALKFAMGQLSIRDMERRISEVLSVEGRSYVSAYPELAFDVDRPSDIALAEEALRLRRSG